LNNRVILEPKGTAIQPAQTSQPTAEAETADTNKNSQ
jgi:hypothetical protein